MPIFKDQDRGESHYHPLWSASRIPNTHNKKPTETPKQRADNDEDEVMVGASSWEANMEAQSPPKLQTSDREELIRSIKKGESPTWVPNRSLEEYFATHGDPPHSRLEGQLNKEKTPPLRPAAEIETSPEQDSRSGMTTGCPCEIERPRSALHSGDFCQGSPQTEKQELGKPFIQRRSPVPFGSSPATPWYLPPSPPWCARQGTDLILAKSREREPSLTSFSSSFVLKAPTSPLVHQASNTDLDLSPNMEPMDLSDSPGKANRCLTLPSEAFASFQSSPSSYPRGTNAPSPSRSWRREATFPYQAHQPRRSLTSAYTLQPVSSPQTPFMLRSRRPSFSTDVSSPLLHAPMVGSYEESILRGRMSTSPSKPLDFTAQIGVLGRGNCKPSLKCPPHVTVPFPAVFYSYPTSGGGRSISDDSPSPYVGVIDIENTLPREDKLSHRNRRRHASPLKNADKGPEVDTAMSEALTSTTVLQERRKREKRSRRSPSPKSPPGGCYRIPKQGQLQIIIKNPNKTAVKLFLVPYDLEGMEPGTKTFIRQRSYSAGPIIDMPLSASTNLGTDRPEASLSTGGDPTEKPILRYLIHLNICCPSRGRFYLYSTIRVVFANRVPDGKEKLRNEVQYPDPQYSPYKPVKDIGIGSTGSRSAAEKAFRRRSSGYGPALQTPLPMSTFNGREPSLYAQSPPLPPLSTVNLSLPAHSSIKNRPFNRDSPPFRMEHNTLFGYHTSFHTLSGQISPNPPDTPPISLVPSNHHASPSNSRSSIPDADNVCCKLKKRDAGYSGAFGMSTTGGDVGESLLASKLKHLDVMLKQDPSNEQ
ncbi:hypothetical protein PAAG_07733 [Paracoccidioides lutzii Pb01]|uniref:Atos-like conserved domain-containing protein n=1 Tax=Paracoccidioides lutzii (strain ATCC MYA-826 / Pb01) TaxID=502779 RepID=C1HA04_PARBA|nr:hypothetical protein PAAG_07733 [Paracoccidioides lutzii Pb01]EEH37177.2 hypothetical protein PAAG_07733 [Paracoccidioides lutzii Pb01]